MKCGVTNWLARLLALRIGIWLDSRRGTLWVDFSLSYSDLENGHAIFLNVQLRLAITDLLHSEKMKV